jgi:hypothetical protein
MGIWEFRVACIGHNCQLSGSTSVRDVQAKMKRAATGDDDDDDDDETRSSAVRLACCPYSSRL